MSSSNPLGGDIPFFDFSALLGGLAKSDPWKAAIDMAAAIASDGGTEHNLNPADRIAIEDLARVAELHVGQVPGLRLPPTLKVTAVTRSVWSTQSIVAYRPFFERFGEALSENLAAPQDAASGQEGTDIEQMAESLGADPFGGDFAALFPAQIMGQLFASLGPFLVATSAGNMLGHLGRRALGQYDLPVPRATAEVLVVPTNIDRSAKVWNIAVDDLRLWILIHEMVTHAVLSVDHVRSRLDSLLIDFASAFRPNEEAIAEKLGPVTDMAQMQEVSEAFSDPDTVLSLLRSPAQDLLVPQIDALLSAILGYVDHTVSTITESLIPSHDDIRRRMADRASEASPSDRFTERLLGMEVGPVTIERGKTFIDGVVERAGHEGLQRLWADELDLPTAAEVDAPGLWLARIGLTDDAEGMGLNVPDDLSGLEGFGELGGDSPDDSDQDDESE